MFPVIYLLTAKPTNSLITVVTGNFFKKFSFSVKQNDTLAPYIGEPFFKVREKTIYGGTYGI